MSNDEGKLICTSTFDIGHSIFNIASNLQYPSLFQYSISNDEMMTLCLSTSAFDIGHSIFNIASNLRYPSL
jgi:hypothetical protein